MKMSLTLESAAGRHRLCFNENVGKSEVLKDVTKQVDIVLVKMRVEKFPNVCEE